nr:Zn-ribbon domain-containing OB-fold protein [Candidatus Bathyarchaeota archaeon]
MFLRLNEVKGELPSRHWRELPQRYRLEASFCPKCSTTYFPPREFCPECGSRELERRKLPHRGKLVTYTVMYTPPKGFELYVPYIVGLVRLEDGTYITAQITDVDPQELDLDIDVEAVIRKIGEKGRDGPIYYSYKFRPAVPNGGSTET